MKSEHGLVDTTREYEADVHERLYRERRWARRDDIGGLLLRLINHPLFSEPQRTSDSTEGTFGFSTQRRRAYMRIGIRVLKGSERRDTTRSSDMGSLSCSRQRMSHSDAPDAF